MLRIVATAAVLTLITSMAQSEPIKLTNAQMDQVKAGLSLPNGNTVLDNFDNPAPGDLHPSLTRRSSTAVDATFGIPASGDPALGFSGSNEGPWSAHFMSPVIGL